MVIWVFSAAHWMLLHFQALLYRQIEQQLCGFWIVTVFWTGWIGLWLQTPPFQSEDHLSFHQMCFFYSIYYLFFGHLKELRCACISNKLLLVVMLFDISKMLWCVVWELYSLAVRLFDELSAADAAPITVSVNIIVNISICAVLIYFFCTFFTSF